MPARKYQDQYQQKGDDKNNFNFCKQNRIQLVAKACKGIDGQRMVPTPQPPPKKIKCVARPPDCFKIIPINVINMLKHLCFAGLLIDRTDKKEH